MISASNFKSFSRSLEQFFLTLGQNNFGNKIPILNSSGKKEERIYENGVLSGAAIIYGTDGDKFEFNYVEGIIQGTAIYHAASGASEERSYR